MAKARARSGARHPTRPTGDSGKTVSREEYAAAADEAQRQIDERDRFNREWDRIASERNQLAAQHRALLANRGNAYDAVHNGDRDPETVRRFHLLAQLGVEIERYDAELRSLELSVGVRAFDTDPARTGKVDAMNPDEAEPLESAIWRVLLERGAKPEHIARAENRDVANEDVAGTREAGAAKRIREAMLPYYSRLCDRLRAVRRALTSAEEADLARVEGIIARLTPRAYSKKLRSPQ